MIEKLLAAFADGAGDTGPRPGVGVEEIADILWLAARVDPAGARTPAEPPAPPGGEQQPAGAPEPPEAGPASGGGRDGAEPAVQLYPAAVPVRAGAGKPADATGGRRGTPLRLPRAGSLDDPLGLMRSLRPLGRRSIGGPGEELDEQLTVERSIERMVPTPVLRPAESRWLDLALVVDTHHSMLLWADLVDELRRVLTRSGVFRDVRTWQLTGTGSGATPMVNRGRGGPPRNPLELADPAGRRLFLVLSDTVAGGWREAPLQAVLRHWSGHNPVAVLNVLPERLWTRGAVRPTPFAVRADRPAAATRSWQRVPTARRARRRRPSRGMVPVVGLASASLARLLRVVSGDGRWRRLACLSLDAEPGYVAPPAAPAPAAPTALEAVDRFRANASPTAQQLAAHLAAVPLTLPVMTLVRRSLLRDSEHGHLAEVALGGLFEPWGAEQSAEEVEFEFLPGVREALLGSQLRGEVAAVRELVRRRVWEYMSRNRGPGPDFSATRVTNGREGRRLVPDEALPFAARPRPGLPGPGLTDRVVRVRYDAMPEPQEVGTLLTPRLVLTVGDDLLARNTVAWVRVRGGRELPCRPVWGDEALPRVFLLLADEDLVEPEAWPGPLGWAFGAVAPERVRVDGSTDRGDPVTLTGELLPDEGTRNGELVRLSTEPETWMHFRGGPVSRDGQLIGVVHGVWPDRMVFLAAHALLEHGSGFHAAMAEHARGRSGESPETGDRGGSVYLGVTVRVSTEVTRQVAVPEVAALLREVMDEIGATGEVIETSPADLLVVMREPRALGYAGRLLSEVDARLFAFKRARPEWMLALAVSMGVDEDSPETVGYGGGGYGGTLGKALRLIRFPELAERWQWPSETRPLDVVLSHAMYERVGELLGPAALASLTPLAGGLEGWSCNGVAGELGRLVAEAHGILGTDIVWQTCDFTDPEAPGRLWCIGICVLGHTRCLAHLEPGQRASFLGTVRPGSPVDFRGTTFDGGLLTELLEALRDLGSGEVRLGPAIFDHARFTDHWSTVGASFAGHASFRRAEFEGRALFLETTFAGPVVFDDVVIRSSAEFGRSLFADVATFRRAVFMDTTGFTQCTFNAQVFFDQGVFEAPSDMNGSRFEEPAHFTRTRFREPIGLHEAEFLGLVTFAHAVWERGLLSTGMRFEGPVTFDHAELRGRVSFERMTFAANPTFPLPPAPEHHRWVVERRSDGSWDISLLEPDEEESGSGA
ncbi:SAV_2336 N-terminal domain-related protein [Streptomyces sp. NPDC059874]|uniref:SAV_2336 N-terminal domain-related protein n=1 Tax=Streptomyces sp. NPDC059874 TaxID=3346983 RepID=UPI00364FF3CD